MFKNKKILIVGASSDLAKELNKALSSQGAILGLHYNNNPKSLESFEESDMLKKFQANLDSKTACHNLIDSFVLWAGSIDILVQLSGNINRPIDWRELDEKDWNHDLSINLMMPFFLAQKAARLMEIGGGNILLTSTSSASHGGGTSSLAYGVAKSGVECMIKRMAKDCAPYNILINAIAPGFIPTKFHTDKIGMSWGQIKDRMLTIPLKRPGTTIEITETILFLISDKASFITGQTITVDGGDWL